MTIYQMIRKCFDNTVTDCVTYRYEDARSLARAARRFVKMEEKQKMGGDWEVFRTACRKMERKVLK